MRNTYAGGPRTSTLRQSAYGGRSRSGLRHRIYRTEPTPSAPNVGPPPSSATATAAEEKPLLDLDKKLIAAVNLLHEMRREKDAIMRALDEFKLARGNKAELAKRINEVLHMMGKDPEDFINPEDFNKSELQKRFKTIVLEHNIGSEDSDGGRDEEEDEEG